jgi:hypothetical protein
MYVFWLLYEFFDNRNASQVHVGVDVVYFRLMSSEISNHTHKVLRPLKWNARCHISEQLQRFSVTEYRYSEVVNNAAAYSVTTYSKAKSYFLCEQRNSKDSYQKVKRRVTSEPFHYIMWLDEAYIFFQSCEIVAIVYCILMQQGGWLQIPVLYVHAMFCYLVVYWMIGPV